MDWLAQLVLIFGIMLFLMLVGMPVGFCFLTTILVFAFLLWGGQKGLEQIIHVLTNSLSQFVLVALPFFILMGEVIFHSGMFSKVTDALDIIMGRIPGRLSYIVVAAGTLLASMSGSSVSSTAVLTSTVLPEMMKRGYKHSMSAGPILGSGGLAILIPPSSLAIIIGAIGEISIGHILIGIIIPGLLLAFSYVSYIAIRVHFKPEEAPSYFITPSSWIQKFKGLINILPLGLIIFMVIGVMFIGFATPSEAAVTGALACFIVAAFYKKLNWIVIKRSLTSTLMTTGMILIIVCAAMVFSQLLVFSGATMGLVEFVSKLPLPPIAVLILIFVIGIVMGMFMEVSSILMVTVPIFLPIIKALGGDPVWFAVSYLLVMEMGMITPPFGMNVFVMKGLAPPEITIGNLYSAGLPFLFCNFVILALLIVFPDLALWLIRIMPG